jgi:RNA-binding protein
LIYCPLVYTYRPIMLFHNLSLEAFCHSTEDLDKVKEAMLNLLPPGQEPEFKTESLEGSFGNEIIKVSAGFKKQQDIKSVVSFITERLGPLKGFDVDSHVSDEGFFWIRFDKQEAFEGKITRGGKDTIQLKGKVAAFPAKRENVVDAMWKLWC